MSFEHVPQSVSPEQLHILQHSLGLDRFGGGRSYRNHFVTSEDTTDWPIIQSLVALGLMIPRRVREGLLDKRDRVFCVTVEGESVVEHAKETTKLSRGKKRYREWLRSDGVLTFGEWLKATAQTNVT